MRARSRTCSNEFSDRDAFSRQPLKTVAHWLWWRTKRERTHGGRRRGTPRASVPRSQPNSGVHRRYSRTSGVSRFTRKGENRASSCRIQPASPSVRAAAQRRGSANAGAVHHGEVSKGLGAIAGRLGPRTNRSISVTAWTRPSRCGGRVISRVENRRDAEHVKHRPEQSGHGTRTPWDYGRLPWPTARRKYHLDDWLGAEKSVVKAALESACSMTTSNVLLSGFVRETLRSGATWRVPDQCWEGLLGVASGSLAGSGTNPTKLPAVGSGVPSGECMHSRPRPS